MSKLIPAAWRPVALLCVMTGCTTPGQPISTTPASDEQAAELIAQAAASGEPVLVSDGKEAKEVYCRQESVANTRLSSRRICLTAEQWQERGRATREALRDATRHGLPPTGN